MATISTFVMSVLAVTTLSLLVVKFKLNCPWLLNPSLNVLKFNLVSENLILFRTDCLLLSKILKLTLGLNVNFAKKSGFDFF